jgi:hypothetical protein
LRTKKQRAINILERNRREAAEKEKKRLADIEMKKKKKLGKNGKYQ